MEIGSPGTSTFVELVSKPKKSNIELCIICQKVRDSNQNIKLTSAPEGRDVAIKTSRTLSDDTLYRLNETDFNKIQYHVKTYYVRYKKAGERSEKKELGKRSHTETFPSDQMTSTERREKKNKKTVDTRDSRNKYATRLYMKDRKFDFKSKIEIELKTF